MGNRFKSLRAWALAGVAGSVLAGPVLAQAVHHVDLAPQPLATALETFGRQTGEQVMFDRRDMVGKASPAVRGDLSPDVALVRLLSGSGLVMRWAAPHTIVIAPAARMRITPVQTLQTETSATSPSPSATPAEAPRADDAARQTLAEASPPKASAEAAVSEVVVVGSQIRGAKVTAALPVTVVDQKQIDSTGAVSGDELFRSIPQMGDVTFNSSYMPFSSNGARGDVNSVNLRSLGVGNTLVLLNGRRVVTHPTSQANDQLVPVLGYNTNAIPIEGLKRLEVLRDGAAAIYGADAVAGVVNTVLQDRFDGLTVDAQYGAADGTGFSESEFNVFAGHNFQNGRGNISLIANYTDRTQLFSTDQDYTASSDKRPLFASDPVFAGSASLDGRNATNVWAALGTPAANGTIRQGATALTTSAGLFHIQPTAIGSCATTIGATGLCIGTGAVPTSGIGRDLRFDTQATGVTITPSVHRENIFLTGDYEIVPGLTAFGELGYYHAQTHAAESPVYTLSSLPITIPASNYYNPFGPTVFANGQVNPNRLPGLTNVPAAGLPVTLRTYLFADAGSQSVDVENFQSRILAGLKGEKWGFHWETAGLFSEAQVKDVSDNISATLLQRQLALSTPDAYNPFNGGCLAATSIGDCTRSSQAAINAIKVRVTRQDYTQLALGDFKVSRPDLYHLPGGDLGMAAGVEVRHEVQKDGRDPLIDGSQPFVDSVTGVVNLSGVVNTSPSPDTVGSRTVGSAFIEFAVPVVSPEMHIPLVRSFELQLAGRVEDYSDFGAVAKPKVAGAWDVFDGVRLRGSFSQGFRAPNLEQLNATLVTRSNTRTDYVRCEADLRAKRITSFANCTRTLSVSAQRAGNPGLEPESSDEYSAGVVLEPKFLPQALGHITLTVDWWKINQKKIVGLFGEGNALIADYLARETGGTNPSVVRAAPTADDIAAFAGTGLAPAGTVLYVTDQYRNLLPEQVEGLDVGFLWSLRQTPVGDFDLNINAAHLIKFYLEPSPDIAALLAARASGQINAGTAITGAANLLRQNGRPTWKFSASFTWTHRQFQVGAFTQYTSAVNDTGLIDSLGNSFLIDSQITGNIYAQYTVRDVKWAGWANDTRLRVGVRNFTDANPPLSSSGYLGTLYNPYGRYWYVNIRKSF